MIHFDLTGRNAAALKAVQVLRPFPVYPSHRLRQGGSGTRIRKAHNRAANAEADRREAIRAINEELSTYYELPAGQTVWGRPELLAEGKCDYDHSQEPFP